MLPSIASNIASYFIKKSIISEDEQEVYNYCFELLLSFIINCILLLIYSIIARRIIETIFFVIGFMPLRLAAGGYHAKTHFRCCMSLMILYILFLGIVNYTNSAFYNIISITIAIVSIIVVFIIAPIEDDNKKLEINETRHLKIKSRIIASIDLIVVVILTLLLKQNIYIFTFSLGISMSILLLVTAKLKKLTFGLRIKKGVVNL